MTNEERDLINKLSETLKGNNVAKDVEADAYLQQTVATAPDAIYKLALIAIVKEMEIGQLRSELQASKVQNQPTSFLGAFKQKIFGAAPAAAGMSIAAAPRPMQNTPGAAPAGQPAMSPAYPQQNAAGGSSFLQSAASVGLGVAGGMLLANTLGNMFGHNSGMGGGSMPQESVTNNYYGDTPNNPADNVGGNDANFNANDSNMTDDVTDNNAGSDWDNDNSGGGDWGGDSW